MRKILKDQGVFAELDRLSGETLSIFYLHGGGNHVSRFNETFTKAIGIKDARIPCVVFFRSTKKGFADVSVVPLESGSLIHGFHELYSVIEEYKKRRPLIAGTMRHLRWIPGVIKVIAMETLKAALKATFDRLP